ncbi:hypothetical protein GMSM_26720 [Geomonas sp. Red276]
MTIVLGLWKLLRGIGLYSYIAVIVAFVLLISFLTRPFASPEPRRI